MPRTYLSDEQWSRIKDFLLGKSNDCGVTAKDNRQFLEAVEKSGATPVVPPRSHRKNKRNYYKVLYKERNLVERFFMKVKNFRRVATRYERLERNYMAMLNIAALTLWLK